MFDTIVAIHRARNIGLASGPSRVPAGAAADVIAQTAQQPQPNAPQKLWTSAAGTFAPSAAA